MASVSMSRHPGSGDQRPLGLSQALVCAITGFHIVAAYAESGLVAGTVRSITGPVMAAVLWHYVFDVVQADPPSRLAHRAERTRTHPLQLQDHRTQR